MEKIVCIAAGSALSTARLVKVVQLRWLYSYYERISTSEVVAKNLHRRSARRSHISRVGRRGFDETNASCVAKALVQ